MRNLPERRVLFRWMFNGLGYVLFFGSGPAVRSFAGSDLWAALLFGEDAGGHKLFMAAAYVYVFITGLLCWVTAAGLKRGKRWSRPLGICTSILLLFGFPWLTIAGVIGLYVLMATSWRASPVAAPTKPTKPTKDFWQSKRKSKAQSIALPFVWIAAFAAQTGLEYYAHLTGMPAWRAGWTWWLWFFVFGLVNTALHEFGHAIVAWAVGFKLQVISIGPFGFWRGHAGFHFRFDLGRLFESGGYMGAVPVSDRNLRFNEIAVIVAGPATNAITCLIALAVFFSLPGTGWQNWWWIAAFNAVVACAMGVGNLIPLGYCDGTMLLHLILWTPAGRLLLDRKRVQQIGEEAEACHGQAAFDRKIELHKIMLDRSLAFGQANAFMIAACHQALGSAYVLVDDWPAAEFHYRKCLEFEAELAENPALAGNVWSGLHLTSTRRHHLAAAGPTYASLVALLEKQKTSPVDVTGPAMTFTMLGQAHERNRDFQTALVEIEQALKSLPRNSGNIPLRAHLLRCEALCRLHLDEIDAGLAAAESAADLFRSPQFPPARRNSAWENIADLAQEVWRTGQSAVSIQLLREGIAHLESGGAASVAAQYRIKLAAILRQLGRPDDASSELPAEHALWPALRRAFLTERAQLHLIAARPDLAVADCGELVALWRVYPYAAVPEIASAEALLAKACLAAGDLVEAEALALQAADVLGPWQHPDAASCLITLALARSQSTGGSEAARIEEWIRLIETAALLGPAEKARLKEAETARVQQSAAAVPELV